MSTDEKHRENVREAEQIVASNADTYPIIHTRMNGGEVHGYVTEGEAPVACVSLLESELSEVVGDNGVVGGEVALDTSSDGPVHSYTEREPGDEGYIELLNDVLPWYDVVTSETDHSYF